MGLVRRLFGIGKSPVTCGADHRSLANFTFICKDPGRTRSEMEAAANRADIVVDRFDKNFPGRLKGQTEINVHGGQCLLIKMQVYFDDPDDLMRMKRHGDRLVVEHGLSDLG